MVKHHHGEEGVEKESVLSSEEPELLLLGGWLGLTVGRKELESSDSELFDGTGRKEEFLDGTGRKEEFLSPESKAPVCYMLGQELWACVETDCLSEVEKEVDYCLAGSESDYSLTQEGLVESDYF